METEIKNTFERILIALDGSTPSNWAVEVGQQLASQLRASVLLVHVVEPVYFSQNLTLITEIDRIRLGVGKNLLAQAQSEFPKSIASSTSVRLGPAGDQIVAAARRWQADLIVLGSRGHGRFAQLILGSVTQAVIHASPCPVITVAHQPHFVATECRDWIGVGADCAAPLSAHAHEDR